MEEEIIEETFEGEVEEEELEDELGSVGSEEKRRKSAQWVDPEKFEPWQWDRLERYVPSDTSEEEYDLKTISLMKKRKVANQLLGRKMANNRPVKQLTPEELRKYIENHKELFNSFVTLKLINITNKVQTYPPKRSHKDEFWANDYRGPDRMFPNGDLLDGESDIELGTAGYDTEDERSSEEDLKKGRKEDSEKKRHKQPRGQKSSSLKDSPPSQGDGSVVDESDSEDPGYQRTYLNPEQQRVIDRAFALNFLKPRSKYKKKVECKCPDNLNFPKDEPPISIAPSLKHLGEQQLLSLGRNYFLFRVIYVFAFKVKVSIMDIIATRIALMFRAFVANQNSTYALQYRLSGCLLFYNQGLAVAMVEGGEYEVMKHFVEFPKSPVMPHIETGRILSVEVHAHTKFFSSFVFCTSKPPTTLASQHGGKSASQILKKINSKLTRVYNRIRMKKLIDPSKIYELPSYFTSDLPTLQECMFILKYKTLRDLNNFCKNFTDIRQVSDSSDEGWPVPPEVIPYNIWNATPEEIDDIEKETVELKMASGFKKRAISKLVTQQQSEHPEIHLPELPESEITFALRREDDDDKIELPAENENQEAPVTEEEWGRSDVSFHKEEAAQ